MNSPRLPGAVIALACIVCVGPARAERLYSVMPIPLGPFPSIGGQALNEAAHAVGGAGAVSGYYWSPETGLIDLGRARPSALNNHGVVTGTWYDDAARGDRPFTWDVTGRTVRTVPNTADDLESSRGRDVNDAGQIVYQVDGPAGPVGSFLRNPDGTVRRLNDPPEGQWSDAVRLSERGEALGRANFPQEREDRAVYWSAAGEPRRLPGLPGINPFGASDVNASGLIVGNGRTAPSAEDPNRARALLWDLAAGTVKELGALPGDPGAGAFSINDAGEVVGGSGELPGAVASRAFLWTEAEGMLDLTALLDDSGRGWTLRSANDINNRGQILATGLFNGTAGAVILTPVPEPGAAAMLLAPALALLRRRRGGRH